ncbi:acyl-CoA dehydrogenase family protein [Novacetimonas sp. GS1]|uniref:acyl-CoA dehydrogenase family protein n=1 Tax=Novacetimonas sp. GS1 TaxID=3119990 RepID=UPI002FCCCC57
MTGPAHPSHDLPTPRHDAIARLRAVFARIAQGAVEREHSRTLARDAVQWLVDAGFAGLRVPVRHGGLGASLTETFALLSELAEADSNLPQIFRAHFAFVEARLREGDTPQAARWLDLAGHGAVFGAAMAELGDSTGVRTTLRREGGDGGHYAMAAGWGKILLHRDAVCIMDRRGRGGWAASHYTCRADHRAGGGAH